MKQPPKPCSNYSGPKKRGFREVSEPQSPGLGGGGGLSGFHGSVRVEGLGFGDLGLGFISFRGLGFRVGAFKASIGSSLNLDPFSDPFYKGPLTI